MSFHADLLKQADHLVAREPRKPRQASLRRAVSAAYYAVFHLLISDGAALLIRGPGAAQARPVIARAYSHGDMAAVAKGFASGQLRGPLAQALAGSPVQSDLQTVAKAFVDLQEARHKADYDLATTFAREGVQDWIAEARDAFEAWSRIRTTLQARTMLVAMLVGRQLNRR